MPDLLRREQIENELLEAVQLARRAYRTSGHSKAREYQAALKRFNDFIMQGKLPDDPKYGDLKSRTAQA